MATRLKTDLMRKAEEGLGGPLEETLQDALNQRGNAAALAKELGVAKGNIDYWIRKNGLELIGTYCRADQEVVLVPKSTRPADSGRDTRNGDPQQSRDAEDVYQQDEPATDKLPRLIPGLSRMEQALIDAVRSAEFEVEDVADETDAAKVVTAALSLAAQGVSASKIEQLTRSDVQMVNHLKSIGAERSDLLGLTDQTIDCLRDIDERGLRLEDYAKFDMKSLLDLQKAQRSWQRQGVTHEQVAELTHADLELLDAAHDAGWSDSGAMQQDLTLLQAVRDAGLDDPAKIDAVKRLRE